MRRRLGEASRDVARARAALRAEGLWGQPGVTLHADYPLAGEAPGGALLSGSVDLLAITPEDLDILELRTDAPARSLSELERHVGPLRIYARLLEGTALAVGRRVRCGLLFTADARVWWA